MPLLGSRRLSQVTLKAICYRYKRTPQVAGFFYGRSSTATVFTSWLVASLEMMKEKRMYRGEWLQTDGVELDLAV